MSEPHSPTLHSAALRESSSIASDQTGFRFPPGQGEVARTSESRSVQTVPVSRSSASRYLATVRATISDGSSGPGGCLSQSSVSR